MSHSRDDFARSVERYFAALDSLDVEATVACFAEDGSLECVSDGRRAVGPEQLREFVAGVTDGSLGMVHDVVRLVIDVDAGECATEQDYRDRRSDGRVYDERTCNFFSFAADGRLRHVRFWRGASAAGR
jgi:ketosteroid isomerase-like protein